MIQTLKWTFQRILSPKMNCRKGIEKIKYAYVLIGELRLKNSRFIFICVLSLNNLDCSYIKHKSGTSGLLVTAEFILGSFLPQRDPLLK